MSKDIRYLLLIIAIFIAACIETDIFLPAMVDMMNYFNASEEEIQSLLTLNFAGICLSGPLYGPLSDAFGRKKPLLIALGLFLLGSIFTMFALDFTTMLTGRALQGLGSGGCFTLGTAIIFDYFQKEKAMEALNKINSIIPFIMAGAPMLGGALNSYWGFQSNFIAIALFVLFSLLMTLLFFQETLAEDKRTPFNMPNVMKDFKTVMASLAFWQVTWTVSLIFAGYIAFLSTISVLYVTGMGISKEKLPYFQVALLGSWLFANLFFKKAINRFGIPMVKKIGICFFAFGGLGLSIVAGLAPKDPYQQTILMCFYSLGANWINGIFFPEGMSLFPENKGTAASIVTSARLLISAIVVALVSSYYDGSVNSIAVAIFVITVSVSGLLIAYERAKLRDALLNATCEIND